MIVVPYLLSLGVGMVLFIHINKFNPLRDGISLITAWLMGMGEFVILTFFCVQLGNGYHPLFILICACIMAAILIAYGFYKYSSVILQKPSFQLQLFPLLCILIVEAALLMMAFSAGHHPYGDWNAWSFWNFRAKFIMLAGDQWKGAFLYVDQAKHPWFLPYWLIFCQATGSISLEPMALINSIFLACLTLITTMCGVYEQTSNKWAVLASGIWLATIPYFIHHSTGQSADVLMSLLILINVLLLLRFFNHPNRGNALNLGFLLGILAFTKDEGIVCMLIILALILIQEKKRASGQLLSLIKPLIPWFLLLLVVKWWMGLAPSGVNQIKGKNLLDIYRWGYVFGYYFTKHYLDVAVFLLGWMVTYQSRTPLRKNIMVVTNFLILFLGTFFLLYVLVKSDLGWRLYTTNNRLVYELLGVGICLTCMMFFKQKSLPSDP